jgi:hypothetical protein
MAAIAPDIEGSALSFFTHLKRVTYMLLRYVPAVPDNFRLRASRGSVHDNAL